jgi:hypothetical protein
MSKPISEEERARLDAELEQLKEEFGRDVKKLKHLFGLGRALKPWRLKQLESQALRSAAK